MEIANSIECGEVPECDVALGNNVNSPISDGLGDFDNAAGDLYKVGYKPIANEN